MQDRFKFRFYDKDKKIMIDENSDTKYIANIYGRDERYWCIEAQMPKILSYFDGEGFVEGKWHKFNFAIMQCTGLKDKNGKLIYEGDILEFYSQSVLDAISRKGLERRIGKVVWSDEYLKFDVVVKNNAVPNLCKATDDNNFLVIGNIYENPELLED